MIYLSATTHAYHIRYKQSIHSLIFNLDHKSKTFIQDHNIKLVDFDLGFQTKLILYFYELLTKIYEM
jgi:hypothetical protein